jgi:hypothetical protein
VNISEVEAFKESHLISKKIELRSYISIDEGDVPLETMSVVMEFENAQGDINITSPINVTTFVEYKLLSSITSGEHELWILGHPLIQNMKITLPDGMAVVSSDGLENMTSSSIDGRVVLEGESGIRTFMVENRTIFEYATTVDMYKKPFYAESYFLPLLVFILINMKHTSLYATLFIILITIYGSGCLSTDSGEAVNTTVTDFINVVNEGEYGIAYAMYEGKDFLVPASVELIFKNNGFMKYNLRGITFSNQTITENMAVVTAECTLAEYDLAGREVGQIQVPVYFRLQNTDVGWIVTKVSFTEPIVLSEDDMIDIEVEKTNSFLPKTHRLAKKQRSMYG